MMPQDDPERTVVWRRPSATAERRDADQPETPSRGVEAAPGSVTNVNVPVTPGVEPYAARAYTPSPAQQAVWRAQRVIYYIFGVIEALIALRFVLKIIAANATSPFTAGVYGASWVFDFPFSGIVPNANLGGGSMIEFFSIIGIIVYALASIALVKLLGLFV